MTTLGTIPADRLALMPPQYHAAHEFCVHVHDQMLHLLIQYEESGAHRWVEKAFRTALANSKDPPDQIDILQFMREKKLIPIYKHHIVSHLVLALTSDMLHFLYEALICFEKRKFAVAFSLLRKPLKENLLFLCWILADHEDFIDRFESDNYRTLNGLVSEEQRLPILAKAIARLAIKDGFDPKAVHDDIFAKTNAKGFEPLWQRASHLITSQGSLLKTEDYNINFIFNDSSSDHLYEALYEKLPRLMLLAIQVSLECFAFVLQAHERTVSHLILTTMGCYEAIFSTSRKQPVARLLNKSLGSLLKCIHCDQSLQINRKNALDTYIHEQIKCTKCGLPSAFPLYWILTTAKVEIPRDKSPPPLINLAELNADSAG